MKITHIHLPAISVILIACMFLSCSTGSIRSQQRPQVRPDVVKKGSVVNESPLPSDKTRKLSLKESTDLTAVQFLDDNNGWIGGKEKLFKTQDGGRTWEPVKVPFFPDSTVRHISFINPVAGWILL